MQISKDPQTIFTYLHLNLTFILLVGISTRIKAPVERLPRTPSLPFPPSRNGGKHSVDSQSNSSNGALPRHQHGELRRPRGRLLWPLHLPSEAGGLAEAARPHVLRPVPRRRLAPRSPPLPRHLLRMPEAPRRQQRHLHVQVIKSTTRNQSSTRSVFF
jgi:hypothetical protein